MIPTFREVLALCKGKINIYLDFKEASVEAAYKQIREAGMEDHFIVYINNPQQIIDWRRVAPTVPLMISLPKKTDTPELLNAVLSRYSIDLLDGNFDEYNDATVNAAKQKRIPIWADIQNADSEVFWNKALELGLDGLQTDHPKALIDFLIKKHKRIE
jgi:glycerophosphoryl diester phosphodiesterase